MLEIFVVLINAAIAALLLREKPAASSTGKKLGYLVLVNGALLWLMFRDRGEPEKLPPAQMLALAHGLRTKQKKALKNTT